MLKAGFYQRNITPPLGCDIPGFFTPRVADDVLEDIYARAAVIDNGKEKVAMLAIDTCEIYEKEIVDKIIKRVTEYTDIKPENILICSTHLHTAGPLSEDDFLTADKPYMEMMIRFAADAITLADRRRKNVTAKYACGKVEGISFVRNYNMKGGYVMTNPEYGDPDIISPCGEIDPDVPVLVFCDEADKPCGAVVSFACHQDCLCGEKRAYSTDFAGIMDKELKKEYGNDFISVFFEGTCGNVNHHNVKWDKPITLEHHRKMGRILAAEVKSVIADAEVISGDKIVVIKKELSLNKRKFTEEQLEEARKFIKECEGKTIEYTEFNPESPFMKLHYSHRALRYMKDTSDKRKVNLMAIRIGDFVLSAFPGEVFVQFGKYVKDNLPYKNKMVTELAFECCGYIPTRDLFQPTVYESTLPTCIFEPDAGHIMADTLIAISKEAIN